MFIDQTPEPARIVRFAEVDFSLVDEDEAVVEARRRARQSFTYFVTPNVDHVVNLHGLGSSPASADFRHAYAMAALRLCDSRILQRLAATMGIKLTLVTGSDLTVRLFNEVLGPGDRVAIIGAQPHTGAELAKLYPGPTIVQHIPPMGALDKPESVQAIIDFVIDARPNFTLFAIGAPQSEIIAMKIAQSPGATGLGLCVGAAVEFLTGDKVRAPRMMQRMGLEWFYRLLSEPRRLWRRYLVDGPQIFLIAWRSRKAT